jgi:RNA polymerase sigma-70 factor (ECF subfamily)
VAQASTPAAAVWRYRDDVWRLASQLCRHREDAEDVTQSALLNAVRHLDGFRQEASVRTWLHRIATNECRMLRRRRIPLSLDELLEQAATADRRPPDPPAPGPGPEEAAVEAETRRRVVAALAELPDRYRTAVLLKDGLGLPAEAVAAAMGMSVPAVRAVLHRARSALRARLTAAERR